MHSWLADLLKTQDVVACHQGAYVNVRESITLTSAVTQASVSPVLLLHKQTGVKWTVG